MTETLDRPRQSSGFDIFVLAAAAFAAAAANRITDSLLPQIAEDFSVSIGRASAVATTYTLAFGFFQLIHGPLGDRIGKLRLITAMLAVSGAITALSAYVPNLHTLLLARLLSGAAAAAVIPLSMAHLGDTVSRDRLHLVLARFMSGVILGMLAGQALGGVLGDYIGWRGVFLILGAIYVLITIFLVLRLRSTKTANPSRTAARTGLLKSLMQISRSRNARIVVGTVFTEGLLFYGAFTFISAYLRGRFGLSFAAIGLLLGCFGLGAVLYTLLAAPILKRTSQRTMVLTGGVLMTAAFLLLSTALPMKWVWLPLFLSGFGFYLLHTTLQTHASDIAPSRRGLGVSLFSSFFFLGQSAGVAIGGQTVMLAGYLPLFAVAGVSLLVLALYFAHRLSDESFKHPQA